MKKYFFMLQWGDNHGGSYTRSFSTLEERDSFRKMVEKKDWRGQSNVTVWERTVDDTVPFSKEEERSVKDLGINELPSHMLSA